MSANLHVQRSLQPFINRYVSKPICEHHPKLQIRYLNVRSVKIPLQSLNVSMSPPRGLVKAPLPPAPPAASGMISVFGGVIYLPKGMISVFGGVMNLPNGMMVSGGVVKLLMPPLARCEEQLGPTQRASCGP